MEDIDPTLGIDIPYEAPETLKPPELEKSRNRTGMSKKTKDSSPETESRPGAYQTTTNLHGEGGNASEHTNAT
jgi:hypothetical protein